MQKLAYALLAIPALFSCASTPEPPPERLPFHVAVLPVEILYEEPTDPGEGIGATLQLEQAEVTNALCDVLDERFARLTPIVPPQGSGPVSFTGADAAQGRVWLDTIAQVDPDLVVRSSLRQVNRIETRTNDRLYPNLLLFLLGGPFGWLVPDRTYEFETELVVEFVDPELVTRGDVLDSQEAVVLELKCESRDGSLGFLKRADSFGDYALSLICPAGFLARDGDEVRDALEGIALEELAERLVARVEDDREQLLHPSSAGVDFRPANLSIVEGPGGDRLMGEIWLDLGRTQLLRSMTISYEGGISEEPIDLERFLVPSIFRLPGNRPDIAKYEFDVPLSRRPAGSDTVRVKIVDNSTNSLARNFTLDGVQVREAGFRLTQRELQEVRAPVEATFPTEESVEATTTSGL